MVAYDRRLMMMMMIFVIIIMCLSRWQWPLQIHVDTFGCPGNFYEMPPTHVPTTPSKVLSQNKFGLDVHFHIENPPSPSTNSSKVFS